MVFGSCAAGTTLMAWCWCGSKGAPAGGLTSMTLLRSSALVSWQDRVHAFEDLLRGRARHGDRGLQAVLHREQAFGEALDGELAGLAELFLGAPAGVLGLGLGAQVGVRELGVALLEVGRVRRGGFLLNGGLGSGAVGGFGRAGVVGVHPRDVRCIPLGFKRDFSAFADAQSLSAEALQRSQSASFRRSRLVGRPCSIASAGSGWSLRSAASASRRAMLSAVSS